LSVLKLCREVEQIIYYLGIWIVPSNLFLRLVTLFFFSDFCSRRFFYLLYIYVFLFFKKLSITFLTRSFLQRCCDSNLYLLYSLSEKVLSIFAVKKLCEMYTSWKKVRICYFSNKFRYYWLRYSKTETKKIGDRDCTKDSNWINLFSAN